MANNSFIAPTQPSLKGGKIPHGHIILNSKFQGTSLVKCLSELSFTVVFDDTIGLIDCYVSSYCAILLVQESQLIMETEIKQKLRKLAIFPHCKALIAEVTNVSQQYFKDLQERILFSETDVKLVSVTNHREMALMISTLAQTDFQTNYFLQKAKNKTPLEESIVDVVHSFPGVGGKKALDLLTSFHSIKNILMASLQDLTKVVGKTTAESVIKMASFKK